MLDKLSQNARLAIASLISAIVIFAWQLFFVEPMLHEYQEQQEKVELTIPEVEPLKLVLHDRSGIIMHDYDRKTRVPFSNNRVQGSINLLGARFDDLVLTQYSQSLEHPDKKVVLLSPSKALDAYFIEMGWLASNDQITLPDHNTLWKADKSELKPGEILNMTYRNDQNITFKIALKLDDNYLFSVDQSVMNDSGKEISLAPYAVSSRITSVIEQNNYIFHEGLIGVENGTLNEIKYGDIEEDKKIDLGNYSWIGFSDKYWLTSFILDEKTVTRSRATYLYKDNIGRFQISISPSELTKVAAGQSHAWSKMSVFAGAKELELLEEYQKDLNIKLFDRAVDFGMLYFITKPIASLLHVFYQFLNNFGLAILALTVLIKVLLFPLAYKGFKGMNRLKDLQPKIMALKEKYTDDAQMFQKSMLEMYRKEKVNPMGGCLPILLQIPVFFALYKVLYVSIEMRQAPFFWWIKDLSLPDPLSIFNLFGLIPVELPHFLMIGILPALMALTMLIQQSLNPEPTDPVQAKVMKFLPLIFLFMFASFPSGLIVYWTWSNILSILQQVLIKRMTRVK